MSAQSKPRPSSKRLNTPAQPEPTHEEIALRARAIWEEEGRPEGRGVAHWLLAEARLKQGRQTAVDAPALPSNRPGSKCRPSNRGAL